MSINAMLQIVKFGGICFASVGICCATYDFFTGAGPLTPTGLNAIGCLIVSIVLLVAMRQSGMYEESHDDQR
jgi:hypothetical protein